jgi:hypothetical protein
MSVSSRATPTSFSTTSAGAFARNAGFSSFPWTRASSRSTYSTSLRRRAISAAKSMSPVSGT